MEQPIASESFETWFERATGFRPYAYQETLARMPLWPDVLDAPTGSGKTAVVLVWLWRRTHALPGVCEATARRLVYCLPRRTLVEQTVATVRRWLARLDLLAGGPGDPSRVHVEPVLGGQGRPPRGSRGYAWWHYPECPAVLVGTQDMLLSRALNRGYASPRPRWPLEFGLLHNDAMWVCDEVQLMDDGLATTAQLAGLREAMGHFGASPTLWMSATIRPESVRTIDHTTHPRTLRLWDHVPSAGEDTLAHRLDAYKELRASEFAAVAPEALAAAILREHRPTSLSLVIVNRVASAQALHAALGRQISRLDNPPPCLLWHARFRPCDRAAWLEAVTPPLDGPGRILVATQVIEAGVDVDALTLWTELAPWPSLVQRFGRCNRAGKATPQGPARVFWLDVASEERQATPYDVADLDRARHHLRYLEGQSVGPTALRCVELPPSPPPRHLLRRVDLVGLFDTSSDLAGNDLDVSRFVRNISDADVYVFWRSWTGAAPDPALRGHAEELCPVPLGLLRDFLRKANCRAWVYDHLLPGWTAGGPAEIRPGRTVLLPSEAGGYSAVRGWTGIPADGPVPEATVPGVAAEADQADNEDAFDAEEPWGSGEPQTIAAHTDRVVAALDRILARTGDLVPADAAQSLRQAARYHDGGKAHPVFQETMQRSGCPTEPALLWAKAGRHGPRHTRRHFRHELVSLLLFLEDSGWAEDRRTSLAAYLIAAHHGRLRLAIRGFPDEHMPGHPLAERHVLGVRESDAVPAPGRPIDLGGGVSTPARQSLDLALIELGLGDDGRSSWTERALRLRDTPDVGPFRLAYLEALLRAADARADEAL